MQDEILRWFDGRYTPEEINQIENIKILYQSFIDQNLPEFFKDIDYKNKAQRKSISMQSCYLKYWEEKIGDKAHHEIKELIKTICIYQDERVQQNRGYFDDPRSLLLHYLKEQFVYISTLEYEKGKALSIKWSAFLKELWLRDIFKPSGSQKTMKGALRDIIEKLSKTVIPTIEFEISNRSALEHIDCLLKEIKKLFENTIRFLLFVFRNSKNPIPKNVTLEEIRNPTYSDMKLFVEEIMPETIKKIIGMENKFELVITSTSTFQIQYFNESEITKNVTSLLFLGNNSSQSSMITLPFFSKTSQKTEKNNGIDEYFFKNIKDIISCTILLSEILNFYNLFLLAKDCAKHGGDLLVYGFCNKEFNKDVSECAKFLSALLKKIDEVNELAINRWANIEGDLKVNEKNWKDNYDVSRDYYKDLRKNAENSLIQLSNLMKSISQYNFEELLRKTQLAREAYIKYHENFHNRFSDTISSSNNHSALTTPISTPQNTNTPQLTQTGSVSDMALALLKKMENT